MIFAAFSGFRVRDRRYIQRALLHSCFQLVVPPQEEWSFSLETCFSWWRRRRDEPVATQVMRSVLVP